MLKSEANRKQELVEHLAQVHALTQAVASAISAIEKNDLRKLEEHLAMQETICNRLAGAKGMLLPAGKEKLPPAETADAELLREIRQAHIALAQLNRVYAALLKRTRRSAGLILALYRSHGEGYDRKVSTLSQRHTWSCEV
jgi:hypothetical protein